MDINLSLGINTKVDATNRVLEAIGSVGINSDEEIDWNIDAADASNLIDAMSQEIQTNMGKGFWFNREAFHKLTPDPVTGYVVVPNNTLSCTITRNNDGSVMPVTLRGTTLFDSENLGYDMRSLVNSAGVLPCVLVVNLTFEFLPATARHAITNAARFWVVTDKEGDQVKMASLKQAADASYAAMVAENNGQRRRNMFQNKGIARAVHHAGGYNNN